MVKKKKSSSSKSSSSKTKTFGSLRKEYEKSLEKARNIHLTPAQKKAEKPTLQKRQEQLAQEYSKKKKELIKKKLESLGKSASAYLKGALTLKKPTAKLPSYSAKKFISTLAQQQGGLVSQQDPLRERYENPQVDNRSLFFREEFKREKKKAFGGFI